MHIARRGAKCSKLPPLGAVFATGASSTGALWSILLHREQSAGRVKSRLWCVIGGIEPLLEAAKT
jgi:hypothetical protein